MSDTFLKHVKHAEIASHEERGWVVVSDLSDCHHGHYSVLMEFREQGEFDMG